MRRAWSVAILALFVCSGAPIVHAQTIDGSTDFSFSQYDLGVTAWGSAQYINSDGYAGPASMSGSIGIYKEPSELIAADFWITYTGAWQGSVDGMGEYNACYASSVAAETWEVSRSFFSTWRCVGPEPPPPPAPEYLAGNPTTGDTCRESPIVINARSGKYTFSSAGDGVRFDINADGTAEQVAWPAASDVTAFLYLDRNGNATPDNGAELFGNHTPLKDGRVAAHGFEALAELDANADGAVTPADPRWTDLRLWFDSNRDGASQAREITTLAEAGVRSIAVAPKWSGHRDRHGNLLRWRAMITTTDPAGQSLRLPFYDVYLTVTP